MIIFPLLALFKAPKVQTSNLTQLVTFKEAGAPTAKTIAELSKAAGVPLYVDPAAQTDTLVIDVKNVPLNTLMAKIAVATDGKWTFENGQFTLSIDDAKRAQKDKAALRLRGHELDHQIHEIINADTPLNPHHLYDEHGDQIDRGDQENISPFFDGDMGEAKALQYLGAQYLASITPGERIVFSSNPTAAEHPLPKSISDGLFHDYLAEEAQPHHLVTDGVPTKAILVLTRPAYNDVSDPDLHSSVEVIFDASGNALMKEPSALDFDSDPGVKNERPDFSPMDTQLKVPSSPLAHQWSASCRTNRQIDRLPTSTIEALLDVTHHDPLAPLGEVMQLLSEARNQDLVADIPDSLNSEFHIGQSDMTATEVFTELKNCDSIAVQSRSNWVMVTPVDGTHQRRLYTNRVSLRNFVLSLRSKTFLDLNSYLSYATLFDHARTSELTSYFAWLANPSLAPTLTQANWPFIRFVHSLNPACLKIGRTTRYPYALCSPAQRHMISAMIYQWTDLQVAGSDETIKPDSDYASAIDDENTNILRHDRDFGYDGDGRVQPTMMGPWGLPKSGYFDISVAKSPILVAANVRDIRDKATALTSASIETVAAAVATNRKADQLFIPHSLKLGTRTRYTIKFYLTPTVFQKWSFDSDKLDASNEVYTLDTLPAALRDRYVVDWSKFKLWTATHPESQE